MCLLVEKYTVHCEDCLAVLNINNLRNYFYEDFVNWQDILFLCKKFGQ